ncbi:3-deoxy-D-manno-octulosonic acid kinase [Pseudoalteromonas citrea]|uniref:3-deoxy-D-manno-octulosonic acid kinase n=2 Tax=Pseudoalteromonas citrea TaxID=43655 RepID=A0AAD4ALE2_9GAMM|nr:3-deoxy-D-manno-octulosonic acid kinase [Pseudoalteromonas citrea]KAF7774451.1 3-deoxy-D-manno-octulosonic acid kinase [Pseudoalteromonas citrea]
MLITDIEQGYILTPDHANTAFLPEHFDPNYWQQKNAIVGTKEGRATAWFFRHDDKISVLKHYWRGGMIGKLLSDQYFYQGLKNTRVYKEFLLLCELEQRGLPVPSPVAAKVSTSYGIYRGDLITAAITGATSLCEVLQTKDLSFNQLNKVAQTIAQFHSVGVYHADLNINNILFDETGDVYLIDFDRGELRAPAPNWQKQNIDRLRRSFNKEAGKWPTFYFTDESWEQFHLAYKHALAGLSGEK